LFALKTAVEWRWKHDAWRNAIAYDGKGYYSYLPAVFIYHDLQWKFMDSYEKAHYSPQEYFDYTYDVDGRKIDKYFCGVSVFQLPFFLAALLFTHLSGLNADGYSQAFQLGVSLASLFYFALGIYFLSRLLLRFGIRRSIAAVVLALITWGTNLFYYATCEPGMSHVYSFCAVSGFLLFLKLALTENRTGQFLWSAFFYGLVCIIRPTNAIVILALPAFAGGWNSLLAFFKQLFAEKKRFFLTALVFSSVIGLQLAMFYLQTGRVFVWSYGHEGFNFKHPELFNILFSYRKGLFIYTPLLLLAFFGLFFLARENRFSAIFLFILLGGSLYVISCWWQWWYGGSFGMRPFIEFYPFMALLLAILLSRARSIAFKIFSWAFCLLCLIYTHHQTWQYHSGMIHYMDMDESRFWKVFMSSDFSVLGPPPVPDKTDELQHLDKKLSFSNDFDTTGVMRPDQGFSTEVAHSGKYSIRLDKKVNFSPGFTVYGSAMAGIKRPMIHASVMICLRDKNTDAVLVIAYKNGEQQYNWHGIPLKDKVNKVKEWSKVDIVEELPLLRSATDKMQVYIYSTSEPPVYIDDLLVEIGEKKE
jgi:hypothetical protein